jgi:uncharacterized protein with NRDE domain
LQNYKAFCNSKRVCTLAIYYRMLADYPLLVAANRDEQYDRPSAPPQRLGSHPSIVAGRDLRAGGTWLGISEHGVLAAMLNRRINSGNAAVPGARSRGLLCMDLLARRSAANADSWLRTHSASYNPFTALVADRHDAFVSYNSQQGIVTERLNPGLHVFSSAADFDLHSSKADRAYQLFGAVTDVLRRSQEADRDAVAALHTVLRDHSLPPGSADPGDAICVHRAGSGTVSATIALLPADFSSFRFAHCSGPPCENSFGAALELEIQ